MMGLKLSSFALGLGLAALSSSFGETVRRGMQDMVSRGRDVAMDAQGEFAEEFQPQAGRPGALVGCFQELQREVRAEREELQELAAGIRALRERVEMMEGRWNRAEGPEGGEV